MPTTDSPLRYPGGKSQLAPLVIDVLRTNDLFYGHYVEPCAGGAGIAWKLLLNGYVSHVHLNDLDPSIYAFWSCALYRTDEFCERVERVRLSIPQWKKQRAIQQNRRVNRMDLALSTFYLNRTNRSGIISGGVIGGIDQAGDYPMDCRFDKTNLIHKIRRLANHREQVSLYRRDAASFLRTVVPRLQKRTLVNLDPPYYAQGPELYRNFYKPKDHAALAAAVRGIKQSWMVTYDDTPETRKLYARYPSFTHELKYTAQVKRLGVELLVLDPRLELPASLRPQQNALRRAA